MKQFRLGEVIGKARTKKGLSLRELSRRTGISHPYLSQIENGKNDSPSKEFLLKLADVLDLPFAFLISISSTDMGLTNEIAKDVIDTYRYYIPSFIDNIHTAEEFINLILRGDIEKRPDYYTNMKIMEIKHFFNEVKTIEILTRRNSNANNLEILKKVLGNSNPHIKKDVLSDYEPAISLEDYLFSERKVMVNGKALSDEDKTKLIEIANTIFK
ncbi:helix-turn-helix transcriptional regulator [Psychrobacillus sp. FSL K6-2843]|uniref:helix-turn-helix domain-containing protein n=1 Tax=Psychrobacillus sp. FSL K6-2843 TaxID=2921549 RepID=UPI00315AA715